MPEKGFEPLGLKLPFTTFEKKFNGVCKAIRTWTSYPQVTEWFLYYVCVVTVRFPTDSGLGVAPPTTSDSEKKVAICLVSADTENKVRTALLYCSRFAAEQGPNITLLPVVVSSDPANVPPSATPVLTRFAATFGEIVSAGVAAKGQYVVKNDKVADQYRFPDPLFEVETASLDVPPGSELSAFMALQRDSANIGSAGFCGLGARSTVFKTKGRGEGQGERVRRFARKQAAEFRALSDFVRLLYTIRDFLSPCSEGREVMNEAEATSAAKCFLSLWSPVLPVSIPLSMPRSGTLVNSQASPSVATAAYPPPPKLRLHSTKKSGATRNGPIQRDQRLREELQSLMAAIHLGRVRLVTLSMYRHTRVFFVRERELKEALIGPGFSFVCLNCTEFQNSCRSHISTGEMRIMLASEKGVCPEFTFLQLMVICYNVLFFFFPYKRLFSDL